MDGSHEWRFRGEEEEEEWRWRGGAMGRLSIFRYLFAVRRSERAGGIERGREGSRVSERKK